MNCSGKMCPFNRNTFEKCNFENQSDCLYYTPEINYEEMYENFCNHIADLVVEKLIKRT